MKWRLIIEMGVALWFFLGLMLVLSLCIVSARSDREMHARTARRLAERQQMGHPNG